MDRKDFLRNASAATALAFFGLTIESCSSDSEDNTPQPTPGNDISFDLNEAPFNRLASDGGWLLHPNENILLVNIAGNISAFSSRCTHTGCTRDWSFPDNEFRCNCHGSRFDTSGNVTVGPADSPLARRTVVRNGDTVTIS